MPLPQKLSSELSYGFNGGHCRFYRTHGRSTKSTSKTFQKHRPHKPASKPRLPIPFIDDLKQVHDPDQALSLFHDFRKMGVKHGYASFSSLVYKLARSRRFEQIKPLLGFIKERNIRCKEAMFIALMRHYGKCNLVDECVDLFHQMPSFNCDLSVQSFNTLLNVLVNCNRFLVANDVFSRCSKLGFRPNSVSFNIIMKGWLEKGEIEHACKVFDEMLDREIQPSVVTYNSLIGYLCGKGEIEKAMELINDMKVRGKHPNAVTYAVVMKGLCDLGRYKEARKIMFDMEYQGCKIKVINFGVLLNDLAKRGKMEEANSLLIEMKKKGLKPDVVTYNILINYLCKEGKPEEAYKILVDMKLKGCEPNAATYRILVDGFCQVDEFERASGIFNVMLMSRHCPRYETLCHLVVGLLKCRKINNACFVLEEMEKRKMRLEYSCWESLVNEICSVDTDTFELIDLVAAKSDKVRLREWQLAPVPLFLHFCILQATCFGAATSATTAPGGVATGVTTAPGGAAPVAGTAPGGLGAGSVSIPPGGVAGAATAPGGAVGDAGLDGHPTLIFYMHDILGGSNPTAKAVTGIVANPAVSGQIPFAKPNGAVLPTNNGIPQNNDNSGIINNNNLPFLVGLSGNTQNVMQNSGNSIFGGSAGFPVVNGAQLQSGTTLQKLMFGTLTAIDDELTEGPELGSGMVGKAQGLYVASSVDGTSQVLALTAMFESGGYVDSLVFFGIHRTAVSQSQLAIMGGTGKYTNAKGFATIKILPSAQQQITDGFETLVEFALYLTP